MKNISQTYYDYIYNGKVEDDEDLAYEYNELEELPEDMDNYGREN